MAVVTLDSVSVRAADGTPLLRDVSLQVDHGELVVIVGQSGSGKTSVIRAVAGLEEVVAGSIRFDDLDVTRAEVSERDVGIVFQTQTLFPLHTARGNVGFPLRIRSKSEDEIRKRVVAEARALGIEEVLDRWPQQLSAGHQQLVQIARAMVRVPKVLLLDEPMAHLDPPTRSRLRRDLRELQRGYGVTTIYTTNDPAEAMFMGDRIVALAHGRVKQVGVPPALYEAPADTHVAWLTGPVSFLDGEVRADVEGFWLQGRGYRLRAWSEALRPYVGAAVRIGLRPDDLRVDAHAEIRATVDRPSFEWGSPVTRVQLGESVVAVPDCSEEPGHEIGLHIDRCVVFDSAGDLITVVGAH